MPSVFSKSVDLTCYEVAHVWNPSCSGATLDIFLAAARFSFKTYFTLYALTALIRRKGPGYYLTTVLPSTLQSTLFLTTNGYAYIAAICAIRHATGKFTIWHSFAAGIIASFLAILHERKARRGVLALYMTNIAADQAWNMLVSRGMVHPLPHGEVLLFCVVAAVYMYLYRKPGGLDSTTTAVLNVILGKTDMAAPAQDANLAPRKSSTSPTRTSMAGGEGRTVPTDSRRSRTFWSRMSLIIKHYQNFINNLMNDQALLRYLALKHPACKHEAGCVLDIVFQGLRTMGMGLALQSAVTVVSKLKKIVRNPRLLKTLLFSKTNAQLAAFLTSFTVIFKSVNCALRWLFNSDHELFGLVSGFCAGFSMFYYKSKALTLYLGAKLIEHLYFKGIKTGHLPYVRSADIILYTLCTGFMFHAALYEPHNIRPQYWGFIRGLSGEGLAKPNRHLLEGFGTKAALMYQNYWPKYDHRYTVNIKPPL